MKRNRALPPRLALWPIAEIIVFIIVGYFIGFGWAILLLITTSVLGILLLRNQALTVLHRNPEKMPLLMNDMFSKSLILLSGMLLLIPGFITDVLGLLCLIPFIRKAIIRWLIKRSLFIPHL